jgi:hypothetical protein
MLRLILVFAGATSLLAAPGVITYDSLQGAPYSVTYDNRSLFINGERTLFFSFGMHYTRATQAQWDDLLAKAVDDGYTMVQVRCFEVWVLARKYKRDERTLPVAMQTYVFWNAHQHKPGDWDFDGPLAGNYNLTAFIVAAAKHGLFVNLRIGPYVCAEWNFGEFVIRVHTPQTLRLAPAASYFTVLSKILGGFPLWLTDVPGLQDRTSAPAWEAQMGTFFNRVVSTVRSFFADRGGPIALAQVGLLSVFVCA